MDGDGSLLYLLSNDRVPFTNSLIFTTNYNPYHLLFNRYVIAPYHQFSNLLDVLFNLLKTEQTRGIRREVIRVLGLLGALDPYKKQLQEARTKRSKMGTPHSKPLNSKKEGLFYPLQC